MTLLIDRRKKWQKECLNWSWSRCGTVCKPRGGKNYEEKRQAFLASDQGQSMFEVIT